MEKELKTLTGEITNYIFESEDSMYKVAKLDTEDGEIICLGRSDNQIKIRGLRIEKS